MSSTPPSPGAAAACSSPARRSRRRRARAAGRARRCSLIMAVRRGAQALRLLRLRAALGGRAMETHQLRASFAATAATRAALPGVWLRVASGALAASLRARQGCLPRLRGCPRGSRRALGQRGAAQPEAEIGLPYIHGVEPNERALYRPLLNFEGGTIIVGTTQSGKGVDPVAARVPGGVPRRRRHRHRSEEFQAPQGQCPARLPGCRSRRCVRRVPPGLSRARHTLRSAVQLAETHRARLAYPVGHAAGHQRQFLRLRLGCGQRRRAGAGRLWKTAPT